MNCPVVAAFDSGNLISVAKLLRDKYPNKPIVIAGDDDQHPVALNGKHRAGKSAGSSNNQSMVSLCFQSSHSMSNHQRNSVILTIWPTKAHWEMEAVKRQVDAGIEKAIPKHTIQKHRPKPSIRKTQNQQQVGKQKQKHKTGLGLIRTGGLIMR